MVSAGVIVVIGGLIILNCYSDLNKVMREMKELKECYREKYYNLSMGVALSYCVEQLGKDYSVEFEQVKEGKSVKTLRWYIFDYTVEKQKSRGFGMIYGTFGGAMAGRGRLDVVRRAFIELIFEDDILMSKKQEGLDFEIML